MRDYNFRRNAKLKEQKRRKELWDGPWYWPAMPYRKQDEDGNKYYIEGKTGSYKRFLKRRSNKIIRKLELEKIGDGNNYRKVFPLWWEWF